MTKRAGCADPPSLLFRRIQLFFVAVLTLSCLPVSPDCHLRDGPGNRDAGGEAMQQGSTENDTYQKVDDQEESCSHQHSVTLLVTCLHAPLLPVSFGLHTSANLPS